MARQLPLFASPYGLNRLSISQVNFNRGGQAPSEVVPLRENSWAFTDLASAIHTGMQILETPRGRATLVELGRRVVRGWAVAGRFRFGGNENEMTGYVNHFLSELRRDFPNVLVQDIGGPDVLAEARRIAPPQWDGNLRAYQPKWAVGLCFNSCRVADMVGATATMWNIAEINPPESRRLLNRHKQFQFLFAVATAHELCHAFTGYLAQGDNSEDYRSYTPPSASHLDFVTIDDGVEVQGESGRWFENAMFGGSLEFFRDRDDDHGQAGIPYLLDSQAVAWRVDSRAVIELSERRFTFPLPTRGPGIDQRERARRGMASLGSTATGASMPAGLTYMRARPNGPRIEYNVPASELERVPIDPRPLRAVRVA